MLITDHTGLSGYLATAIYVLAALAGGIAILFFILMMAIGALQLIHHIL